MAKKSKKGKGERPPMETPPWLKPKGKAHRLPMKAPPGLKPKEKAVQPPMAAPPELKPTGAKGSGRSIDADASMIPKGEGKRPPMTTPPGLKPKGEISIPKQEGEALEPVGEPEAPVEEVKEKEAKRKLIDQYEFKSGNIPIEIKIYSQEGEYAPIYDCSVSAISRTTELVLERIRRELVKEVSLDIAEVTDPNRRVDIETHFKRAIGILIQKYFPGADDDTIAYLTTYLIQKALGMGNIENLMMDSKLEEITINGSYEPVWVFHRQHGWLKTNVQLANEEQIRHFSAVIGRQVGRQISVSSPLLDANLSTGDRLNATLQPITIRGNTMTIRKFASKPWTITDFIRNKTISAEGAAFIWEAIHYEMSMLVAGGTATGKTSMLNSIANFFPPNQRILSIEDTHELRLPKYLHWVPMLTRQPNPEGKGEVSMIHLLVNSLRMRPDRILVGEVRRKREAEVLFEAIHTGHSVYGTVHANNTHETITRLTNPPIEVPKTMVPAIGLIVVQYRNRRSGKRRTYQISEIKEDGEGNIILQYNVKKDALAKEHQSVRLMKTLEEFTGMSRQEINNEIKEKVRILNWMVKHDISDVDSVGKVIAEYYTNHKDLLKDVKADNAKRFITPKEPVKPIKPLKPAKLVKKAAKAKPAKKVSKAKPAKKK